MQNTRPHKKIVQTLVEAMYKIERTSVSQIVNSPKEQDNSLADASEALEQKLNEDAGKSRTNSLYFRSSEEDSKTQYKRMIELKEKLRITFGAPPYEG